MHVHISLDVNNHTSFLSTKILKVIYYYMNIHINSIFYTFSIYYEVQPTVHRARTRDMIVIHTTYSYTKTDESRVVGGNNVVTCVLHPFDHAMNSLQFKYIFPVYLCLKIIYI